MINSLLVLISFSFIQTVALSAVKDEVRNPCPKDKGSGGVEFHVPTDKGGGGMDGCIRDFPLVPVPFDKGGGGGGYFTLEEATKINAREWLLSHEGRQYILGKNSRADEVAKRNIRQRLASTLEKATYKKTVWENLGVINEAWQQLESSQLFELAKSIRNPLGLNVQILDDFNNLDMHVRGVDAEKIPKLIFINIPNAENPENGFLLVNFATYKSEFLSGDDRLVNVTEPSVGKTSAISVPNKVWNQALMLHEAGALLSARNEDYFGVTGSALWYFRGEVLSDVARNLNNQCQEYSGVLAAINSDLYYAKDEFFKEHRYKRQVLKELERAVVGLDYTRSTIGYASRGWEVPIEVIDRCERLSHYTQAYYNRAWTDWRTELNNDFKSAPKMDHPRLKPLYEIANRPYRGIDETNANIEELVDELIRLIDNSEFVIH